jgi:hypothetical protein
MKILRNQFLASSHVDKQGEIFPVRVLSSMVDQANSSYIPFGVEHDPRIPSLGRIRKTRLKLLQDGGCAIEGDIELFDDQSLPTFDKTREMPMPSLDKPTVAYDRSYRDDKNQNIIREISRALGQKPKEEFKESLDPVTVLQILGLFVIGNYAGGFFQKIGADSWDVVKSGLKKLTRSGPKGQLFSFNFDAQHDSGRVVVETILTDPKSSDIEKFITSDLPQLYGALKPVLATEGLWKLVLESEGGKLKILYGVRSDCVPVQLATNSVNLGSDQRLKKGDKN